MTYLTELRILKVSIKSFDLSKFFTKDMFLKDERNENSFSSKSLERIKKLILDHINTTNTYL